MAGTLDSVKSIVVLMLENRSFDNILGYLYFADGNKSPNGDPFDGLTGSETNPRPGGGAPVKVRQETSMTTVPDPDPGEDYQHVNVQLFRTDPPPVPPNATNDGFVTDYVAVGGAPRDIMSCYDPGLVPNLAEICRRYAVCDAWYASVPSQTWTNRAFTHAATSWGMVNNAPYNPFRWKMPTIFQKMSAISGMTWRVYYDENYIALTRLQFPALYKPGYNKNFLGFEHFLNDANAGQLPRYAFIEPNFFANPLTKKKQSDMHPPSDITPGDQFIVRVFNAVVTGPQWKNNEVLLVITFDEHGGCYDHVPPPTNATPPDKKPGQLGFDFKRFGVRVPAVVVSPFVKAGSVFHAAAGAVPYDHTSILATIEKRFGMTNLTKRDQAAPDLSSVLTEVARTDSAPLPLEPAEAVAMVNFEEQQDAASQPLNDLQRGMVEAMKQVVAAQSVPAGAAAAAVGVEGPAPEIAAAMEADPLLARPVETIDDAQQFFADAKKRTGL
jgi:phospholipase C